MSVRFTVAITAILAALPLFSPAANLARAADRDIPSATAKEDFRAARREIQARLRSRQPFERIAGVRELGKYPTVEAAKLLVAVGLRDDAAEVRSATYDTLLDLKDNDEVARYLLITVGKESRRGAVNSTTLPLLAVLLASDQDDVEREVTALLDKLTATLDGLALAESVADELGDHGQEEGVASLAKLAALPAFEREFGLRRAVATALTKINAPAAIGALIEMLDALKGEVMGEIIPHLTAATGQQFESDSAAWREWWKANGKTFQPLAQDARAKGLNTGLEANAGGRSMYYGLRIYARKLVFIIDISGSMLEGGRLIAAKRELLQAIDNLPQDTQFSIVAFNSSVYPWQRQLVPANAAMKQAAARWIGQLEAQQSTASYDALEMGLRFDAEAIYFLTDGAPHGGKVQTPADIVTLITRANYTRRLSIYTIGIGAGVPGSLFDEFLTQLAKQNWGQYRRVDQ